jgi:tRNA wybutosine-synthesizing protein 1
MPTTAQLNKFAYDIAEKSGLDVIDEVEKSRVLLLGDKKPQKYNN